MTPMKVNLAGVNAEGFTALPQGRYVGFVYEAVESEVKNGKNAGAPMLALTLKISDDHPDPEYHGRQAWLYHPFVDGALPFVKMSLIALGYDPTELDVELEFEPEDLVGKPCVIQCGAPRMYDGEMRTNVSRLWPADTEITVAKGESVDDLPF